MTVLSYFIKKRSTVESSDLRSDLFVRHASRERERENFISQVTTITISNNNNQLYGRLPEKANAQKCWPTLTH